jgi:uncharacterized protein YjbI with pentapeptide repeats
MDSADLQCSQTRHLELDITSFKHATVKDISAATWRFDDSAAISHTKFTACSFSGPMFRDRTLKNSEFHSCTLTKVDFTDADLRGTRMNECDLAESLFLGIDVDSNTRFDRCVVTRARFDRHTLESLDNYGGLTKGQRMHLRTIDGALLLRQSYTGFWQWLHLFALILFVAPYAFRLFMDGLRSGTCPVGDQCPTMLDRLWESIYTGGAMNGVLAPWQVGIFIFLLLYNLLRALLLYKAKTLELQETASGVPVIFSWSGAWRQLYRVAQAGFWFNVTLAVFHAFVFLERTVVIKK